MLPNAPTVIAEPFRVMLSTVSAVRVPKLVIFVCAAVCSVPVNNVADKFPVSESNVKLVPLFGARLPVAAVTNNGKHVVSEDSSATVTVVAIAAVPVVS